MKTFATLLIIFLAISFNACKGPRGLPGLDGKPGVDGESFLGTVFEIEFDFTLTNEYNLRYEFPSSFKVYDTDIVLVYMLWETIHYNDNTYDDVWRLMPQTRIFNTQEGTLLLQYNFDYTLYDVQIFLDGDVDFTTLGPGDLENQIFRIVVLPADFAAQANVNNYNSLINSPDLHINSIGKINLKELAQ